MEEKKIKTINREEQYDTLIKIEKIDYYGNPNYASYYKQAMLFDTDRMWHTSDEEYNYDFGVYLNDTYAIFYDNNFIGLIVTSPCETYNCGSFHYGLSIILDTKYRGQKIGDYALKYVMNLLFARPLCEDITAEVLSENDISTALFIKNGFVKIKEDDSTKTLICKNKKYKN